MLLSAPPAGEESDPRAPGRFAARAYFRTHTHSTARCPKAPPARGKTVASNSSLCSARVAPRAPRQVAARRCFRTPAFARQEGLPREPRRFAARVWFRILHCVLGTNGSPCAAPGRGKTVFPDSRVCSARGAPQELRRFAARVCFRILRFVLAKSGSPSAAPGRGKTVCPDSCVWSARGAPQELRRFAARVCFRMLRNATHAGVPPRAPRQFVARRFLQTPKIGRAHV